MITLAVINEEMGMEASMDRVIVLEDPYKSGRDCTTCNGTGEEKGVKCVECGGNHYYRGKKPRAGEDEPDNCTTCVVGEGPLQRKLKWNPCPTCKGKGTSSLIIPEDSQTRPTTGVIQSVGPLCGYRIVAGEWLKMPAEACFKVGDRVLYHNMTGSIFDIGDKRIRYIKEAELLGRLHGVVAKTPLQGEHAELKEVGMPE